MRVFVFMISINQILIEIIVQLKDYPVWNELNFCRNTALWVIIIIRLQAVSVYSRPQRDSSISPGHLPFSVSRQPRAARRCWLDGRCTLHRSSSDSLGLLCRDLAEVCREPTCWSARSLLSSSSGQHTLIAFSGFVVWEARFLCRLRSRYVKG